MKKIEELTKKRCLKEEEGSYGSSKIFSVLVLCLLQRDMEIRGVTSILCWLVIIGAVITALRGDLS